MSTTDNNAKAASTTGATAAQPTEVPAAAKATAATADGYSTPYGVYSGQPDILYPNTPGYTPAAYVPVGGVVLADGDLTYNANRRTKTITVRNTGDRPIQIGSHFHFFEVNRYMEFDRPAAFGYRLNIPATTAIRFEPGEEKQVELVQYSGKVRVIGFNGLTDGYAGLEDIPTYYPVHTRAIRKMEEFGFKSEPESEEEADYTTPQK